jgi:alpha-glucosidase/alpha-D-xyloside xylohydrolase
MKELIGRYKKKFIPIIDPTISAKVRRGNGEEFKGLIDGLQKRVFLRDETGYFMLSKQWAGPVFVPDFTHPNASDYW